MVDIVHYSRNTPNSHLQIMVQRKENAGNWFLLILFSLSTLFSGGPGEWLLCIGCDDVGFAISQIDYVQADNCCSLPERLSTDSRDKSKDLAKRLDQGECDCLSIQVVSFYTKAAIFEPAQISFKHLIDSNSINDGWITLMATASIGLRAPPAIHSSLGRYSLFNQRVSLIL